jgi:hypothetical protein
VFDVAVYTDTRASEALDGIDGFNFQAASSGLTARDRQVIRDGMVHQVVVGWGVDRDPLDHPPSFAYRRQDDRHYLARGVSTGVTNNGRPGNLLTQAIVTASPDDFGSMRPAQLFGALNWNLAKAPGKQLAQWAPPLKVAPQFEAEALGQMIKDDPWAVAHLAEYLSMVEQTMGEEPKRLILITADESTALRWIALGTLFVDAERALGLSIRGLAADPMTTRGDIVAASPSFGPQPDPAVARPGVNVVDLDRRVIGPVETSESARTQAAWFLEQDSGEALAAIELARRWERLLAPELATRAAALVSFPVQLADQAVWLTAVQALRDLAQAGQADELFFYGDALLDVAVTYPVTTHDDAALAGQALLGLISVQSSDLAASLLVATLEAVAARPRARDAWLAVIVEAPAELRLTWADAGARGQAATFFGEMAGLFDDARLADLFTVLNTLAVFEPGGAPAAARSRLARYWAANPGRTRQSGRWADAAEITRELAGRLLGAWRAGDPAAIDALAGGDWSWLGDSPALSPAAASEIAGWIAAADLANRPPPERTAALAAAGPLPAESWPLVWRGAALEADHKLFIAWADSQSLITDRAGAWLAGQIEAFLQTGRPGIGLRRLLVRLAEPDVEVDHPDLADWANQTVQARGYFETAMKYRQVPNRYLDAVAEYVPTMAPLMIDYLGEILVASSDAVGVARVVAAGPEWSYEAVRRALAKRRATVEDLAFALTRALAMVGEGPVALARAAEEFLQGVCDDRKRMSLVDRAAKRGLIDRPTQDRFDSFASQAKKGRLGRRIARAATELRGAMGKED